MPKSNQNPFTLNTRKSFIATAPYENQMKGIPVMPLINLHSEMRQHINATQQHRKIPPPPPKRQIFRTDPEGMQVTAEFQEKKNTQTAVIQQTSLPRVPPKPSISFGQQRQNLLNQNQFVFPRAQNMHNFNSNNFQSSTLHHLPPKSQHFPTIHHPNQMFQKPNQQLVHKQMPHRMLSLTNDYVENRAEKSDPENHIYEMIDENEVSSINFHHSNADETKENSNLFQNLLRAEMMNQIQSCKKIGKNGYLSHLTQQKRMDIIEETAKSLASAAYLEK